MAGMNTSENVVQGYRLSPQQERVWWLERGTQPMRLSAQCRVMLDGPLDPIVLKTALQDIVQRHEIFRTTFQIIPGMTLPVQVIAESAHFSHEKYDLAGQMPCDQERQIEAFYQDLREERTDATGSSSMRTILVKLSDVRHMLLIVLPGYCTDGVTFRNLVQEFESIYNAYLQGDTAILHDPLQYADFAEWQHTLLADEGGQAGRAHWRKQAETVLGALGNRLPFEGVPSAGVSITLKRIPVVISKKSLDHIDDVAKQQASSSSTFFLACWCILLQRLMGQTDVLVGVACDGRTHEEMRDAFGPFAKYLPVRSTLDENLRFSAILTRLQQAVTESYEWQEYFTWEGIQESTEKAVGLYVPFCFEFDEQILSSSGFGLSCVIERRETYLDRFKIRLLCHRRGDVIDAALQYDDSYYTDEVMACLAEQLGTLMSQAACQPEAAIGDLQTLSENERHRVLRVFNTFPSHEPGDQCLHHLFEAQVALTPDNIAVISEDQSLTYRELDRRANQLAHYLKSRGVGPETPVGICLERSLEMIVGLVGILKAGGAYVPIDPSYPKDRLFYLLEDSRAPILLTQKRFRNEFLGATAAIVSIDSEERYFDEYSGLKPSTSETADGVAYVIYTSGSTGRPKGVLVTHRNAVHSTLARLDYYNEPVTCFLLLSSFAFDSSVAGIFWTLSQGGRLFLAQEGVQKAPSELGALIEHAHVTHVLCLPSLYSVLLEQVPVAQLDSLHTIIVAGESCPKEVVLRHQTRLPLAGLFNEYGPTEGTVWSTVYRASVQNEGATVSIGRPIPGGRIYLLDAHMRPVSIGMLGEMHIAGEGVARAYHNRPDLTAEKFIPDPFCSAAGGRLYRTGDLARYRPDGNIEFAGRRDQQVKIRGYRIELGEIEARLLDYPAVQDAIVLVQESHTGDMLVVAYVVTRENGQNTSALRAFLKERLPEYMIPSVTVVLTQFPLTPNGKVDRKALPMPDMIGQLGHQYVAPRTPTEELLAGIWADVLQVARVGVLDNFFEVGGHSLLATQVMSRLPKLLRVELPLRTLFEAPTVAQLAEVVEAKTGKSYEIEANRIPLIPVERGGELPLSFAQQRLWVLAQLDPDSPAYNIPVALRVLGPLDMAALQQSFDEVVRRHEVLRTTFKVNDGEPVQVIAPSLSIPLPVVDLQHVPEQDRQAAADRLAAAEAQRPFDLHYGPMLRVNALRLSPVEHVLLLTVHHIASDAWSAHVLVREVTALYGAFVEQRPSPLTDLPIQYADFAQWQRTWLSGPVLDRELAYWKKILSGDLPLLSLPTDHARRAVQQSPGAALTVVFPQVLSEALTVLSRREGVTLFMLLLTAFDVLLNRYTGMDDLLVGTPIANRNRKEIEGLIGFFVNTIVLRVDVSGNPTFRDLLHRVRGLCFDAYAHQDVPFEKVVDMVQPARDVSLSPLFQVMFDMQNAPTTEMEAPGLRFESVDIATRTSKFDLSLSVQEFEGRLSATMEYSTDLFEAATIDRILRHFHILLEGIVSNPGCRIGHLPLIPNNEQQQWLIDWNGQCGQDLPDECMHRLFERQAAQTPDAIAVTHRTRAMSYDALNRRANRIAHGLMAGVVLPESVIAVIGDRDIDLLAMMLGIMKVGGVYLPLDPAYPDQRVRQMVSNAGVSVVLTLEKLFNRLTTMWEHTPLRERPKLVTLESLLRDDQPDYDLARRSSLQQAAYIIYTSGSTGVPKGAMVEQRGLLNHLLSKIDTLGLTDSDIVAQTASQCFDISVWQFLAPLLCGGQVRIVPDEAAHDPSCLLSVLEDGGVTIWETVPALLQGVLETAPRPIRDVSRSSRLRWVLPTGEALPSKVCRLWFERYPAIPLMNAYGPAECSDDVAVFVMKQSPSTDMIHVPIGRPIQNIRLYILSASLELSPVGVPGELYVSGVGVGRGYAKDSGRTAEVCIPNPFAETLGERMYRTGDRGRYLSEGTIEFLGRLDHQTKVRGFRIELGEIEANLLVYPNIRETVVIVREDAPGDRRLTAYVVFDQDSPVSHSDLRAFLQHSLPEYMIPGTFISLPTLPRNSNGKVDRTALPKPDAGGSSTLRYAAPRTHVEECLVGIWADVLHVERVSIHDNFFDLGGHSMLAVQVMSRIRETMEGIRGQFPLIAVFQYPTVAALAEMLTRPSEGDASPLVAFRTEGSKPPLYCVDPTGTHVKAYQPLAHALREDQPVYGLSLNRLFAMDWRDVSVTDIAKEHVALIRRCQSPGTPFHLLGWSNGGVIALAMAHELERQGESIAFLGILDTQPQVETYSREDLSETDEMLAYVRSDRQEDFLSIAQEERSAFHMQLNALPDAERVDYAIRWAKERDLLSEEEAHSSMEMLKVGYALDKAGAVFMREHANRRLEAPIYAWWTTKTLQRHGEGPIDWSGYTTGTVIVDTVGGDHMDAVHSIQVYQRISEILSGVSGQSPTESVCEMDPAFPEADTYRHESLDGGVNELQPGH